MKAIDQKLIKKIQSELSKTIVSVVADALDETQEDYYWESKSYQDTIEEPLTALVERHSNEVKALKTELNTLKSQLKSTEAKLKQYKEKEQFEYDYGIKAP